MEENQNNTNSKLGGVKSYFSLAHIITIVVLLIVTAFAIVFIINKTNNSPQNTEAMQSQQSYSHNMQNYDNTNSTMHSHMNYNIESEANYLSEMIPHREEAIASAKVLLQGTNRQEMKDFAKIIIDTQTAEVAQMQQWLETRHPGVKPSTTYMPMMRNYNGMTGDELDRAFLEDMIPHHMMAIMQSESFLTQNLAENLDVNPFAEKIRYTQSQEVRLMQNWLPKWFGEEASYHMMGGMSSEMHSEMHGSMHSKMHESAYE